MNAPPTLTIVVSMQLVLMLLGITTAPVFLDSTETVLCALTLTSAKLEFIAATKMQSAQTLWVLQNASALLAFKGTGISALTSTNVGMVFTAAMYTLTV